MANYGQISAGISRGFNRGLATGGRFRGLSSAIARVADSLRQERERKAQFQQGVLGMVTEQKIKSMFDPESQMKMKLYEKVLGTGRSSVGGSEQEGVLGTTSVGGYQPKSFSLGGITFEKQPTEAERQRNIQQKAEEQATVSAEKERQVNISKVRRLNNISNIIEKKWLETQPGKGFGGRMAGLMSIPTSTSQATKQQQIDFAYRNFVKGMRAQLARAMGDVGNLSEPEQKAAMELVPTLGDNYETGMRKIRTIRDFVRTIETGNRKAMKNMLTNSTVSESDIQHTMQKYGLSREEVLRRLGM